jgi:hypothetical protein
VLKSGTSKDKNESEMQGMVEIIKNGNLGSVMKLMNKLGGGYRCKF